MNVAKFIGGVVVVVVGFLIGLVAALWASIVVSRGLLLLLGGAIETTRILTFVSMVLAGLVWWSVTRLPQPWRRSLRIGGFAPAFAFFAEELLIIL